MPFKKGDPRINRKGRIKGTKNYETLRKEAIKELAKINNKTVQEIEIMLHIKGIGEALKGNFQFYKDDMDRTYGQATQKTDVELAGANGGPVELKHDITETIAKIYGTNRNTNKDGA